MAFELTPTNLGKSLGLMIIGYILALLFQIYMLYLNWKQSKVKETTRYIWEETVSTNQWLERNNRLLEEIMEELKWQKKPKKKQPTKRS